MERAAARVSAASAAVVGMAEEEEAKAEVGAELFRGDWEADLGLQEETPEVVDSRKGPVRSRPWSARATTAPCCQPTCPDRSPSRRCTRTFRCTSRGCPKRPATSFRPARRPQRSTRPEPGMPRIHTAECQFGRFRARRQSAYRHLA